MKSDDEPPSTTIQNSPKPRRSKSREISSRFLSPTSSPAHDSGLHSPNKALSPLRRKSTSTDTRKHRSLDEPAGLLRGLWPSSTTNTTSTSSSAVPKLDTLADHLGNERLKDYIERKSHEKRTTTNKGYFSLKSIENEKEKESVKENHRPSVGGSMRYTKESSTLSTSSSSSSPNILPGRFSVDEKVLHKKSSSSHQSKSDFLTENGIVLDTETEFSAASNNSPATTKAIHSSSSGHRKSGIEVSSKYLQELPSRNRSRGLNILNPVSADSSPKMNKKFNIKNAIRRTNSLMGHVNATSQWALSPGRTGSPPMSVENKVKPMSFSSLKPPTSPSKARGVEKLLNLGLMDLFKSRKQISTLTGDVESVHQLRLMYNRSIQWRYANAKADVVNMSINNQVQNYMLSGWISLMKLQCSVIQKKLKLQKQKLEMKTNLILQSQMKILECWTNMEREHLLAISKTKECLHSAICKVPLVEGAKVDVHSASVAVRHAFDLTASIKSLLTSFSPGIEKNQTLLSELAKVVAQEKLLIEECLELFKMISILETQESSLLCCVIQLNSKQRE